MPSTVTIPAPRVISNNLMMASNQWASRPNDERFASVPSLRDHLIAVESSIAVRDVRPCDLVCGFDDTRKVPSLIHRTTGTPLALNNWSAGQLCRMAEVPLGFLSTLTPETASRVLSERWDATATKRDYAPLRLQVKKSNGNGFGLRAITSTSYDRVSNVRIADHLQHLVDDGWRLAPARPAPGQDGAYALTADDVGPWTFMREGEIGIPSGLYAGDRDLFAFLIDTAHPINEPGSEHPLFRGLCLSTSDVGARAQTLDQFIFRAVCGNHIIWDARELRSIRAVHLGDSASRNERKIRMEVSAWRTYGTEGITKFISAAKVLTLGNDRNEIVDLLFSKRILGRKEAETVTATAEKWEHQDGDPRSAWGVMQAITRVSQDGEAHANVRWDADAAGAKVAQLVSVY